MDTMLEIAKRVDSFMMERSAVHDTMRRLASAFKELEIDFAIADAIQLIRVNRLPQEYTEQLNVFVREKFIELWHSAQISEDY